MPPFQPRKRKVLSKEEVIVMLKQGDKIIAWKKHRLGEVYRCSMQRAMQTLRVQTFNQLLTEGKIEETFRPDFDGTAYYKLKE